MTIFAIIVFLFSLAYGKIYPEETESNTTANHLLTEFKKDAESKSEGIILFSDGIVIKGDVFATGYADSKGNWSKFQRSGDHLTLISINGTKTEYSVFTKTDEQFAFVKTAEGWRPSIGEKPFDLQARKEWGKTYILSIDFGSIPTDAKLEEFKNYYRIWNEDFVKKNAEKVQAYIEQSAKRKVKKGFEFELWFVYMTLLVTGAFLLLFFYIRRKRKNL